MESIGGGWIVGFVAGLAASWLVGRAAARRMRWRMGSVVAWVLAFPSGVAVTVAVTFGGSWLIEQFFGWPWGVGTWIMSSLRAGIGAAFIGGLAGVMNGRRL